ncbi:hypothetical protein IGI04_037498 [Brassica rapa subsp. trilocularis]|uniref:Uncharacterized protein n=1 Tax=Brassica rapa subsp. trilocularis TaxID=1813537 RepID=A0ABQ7LHI7_BRACM|nr:hypothetical protein IGI04_037498 [Brassica rapa subsp. trilocularis]
MEKLISAAMLTNDKMKFGLRTRGERGISDGRCCREVGTSGSPAETEWIVRLCRVCLELRR